MINRACGYEQKTAASGRHIHTSTASFDLKAAVMHYTAFYLLYVHHVSIGVLLDKQL